MPNPTHALTSRDYWMLGLVVAIILLSATRWAAELAEDAWFALRHGFKRKTPDSTADIRYAVSGGPFAGSSFTYSGRTYPLRPEVTDSPARPDLFGDEWRKLWDILRRGPVNFVQGPDIYRDFAETLRLKSPASSVRHGGHENLWGEGAPAREPFVVVLGPRFVGKSPVLGAPYKLSSEFETFLREVRGSRYPERLVAQALSYLCNRPPAGWWCSRFPGHTGPCAARPLSQCHHSIVNGRCTYCRKAVDKIGR
jgi:hypothetical protein